MVQEGRESLGFGKQTCNLDSHTEHPEMYIYSTSEREGGRGVVYIEQGISASFLGTCL